LQQKQSQKGLLQLIVDRVRSTSVIQAAMSAFAIQKTL
jgi:hypothetical protein